MKKLCALLLICVLFLSSCERKIYHWEFYYPVEEIQEIKIIEIDRDNNCHELQDVDIELADELYQDILNINYRRYGPTHLYSPREKCFKIVFKNGEYDIISVVEPQHWLYKYAQNGKPRPGTSWYRCDEEEFDALINKYLKEQ